MTKNLRALLRVQLITAWRGFRNGRAASRWGILLIPLMLLGFTPILLLITSMLFGLFVAGKAMGQGEIILTLAFTVGQVACLTFGIFYVISSFYFSKDINLLIPMPIKPGEIVLSKFISIMVGEYMTMLVVVLPAVVIYGLFGHVAWTYLPFALIIFLLLPVIPLVISSLFSIVLMRVTNLRAHRDLWRVFGALLAVGIGFFFNYMSRYGGKNGFFDPNTPQMEQLLQQQRSLFETIGRYFPTSTWAAHALRAGEPAFGIGPFLLFTVVAVAALAAMVWVAEKLFYGGAVGGEETRSSGRVLTRAELARETEQHRSPLWALLSREIKLLNRTPSFLMAALLPIVIVPVMMILPMAQDKELGKFISKAPTLARSPLVPAIGVGIILFMNSMSNLGATAISREGRHFWISRSLPVAPRVQVLAKLLHSLLFTTINVLMVLGGMAYLGMLTPLTFVYVVLGGYAVATATSCGALIIDLLRPNLKWTDPQQAMKGNLNVLFGMLLIWLVLAILAGLTAVLYVLARSLVMPGVIVLFALLAFGLAQAAGALADRRYLEIED